MPVGQDLSGQVINGVRFVESYVHLHASGRKVYGRWRVICRCGQEFTATAYEVRVKGRTCGHCHLRKGIPRWGALVAVENAMLLELAKTGTRTDVAKALSEKLGCTVTKNMVSGRLWRIGACTSKPQPKPKPLLPLPGFCAFPLGHPDTPGFAYCDEPIELGRTYCDKHHKLTHLKEGHRDERRPQA